MGKDKTVQEMVQSWELPEGAGVGFARQEVDAAEYVYPLLQPLGVINTRPLPPLAGRAAVAAAPPTPTPLT